MYRKRINDLIKWELDKFKKPLVYLGARQVGKTWLMQEFGKSKYQKMVCSHVNINPKNM